MTVILPLKSPFFVRGAEGNIYSQDRGSLP